MQRTLTNYKPADQPSLQQPHCSDSIVLRCNVHEHHSFCFVHLNNNMPKHGRRPDSWTANEGSTELVMRMIELVSDSRVLQGLKKQIYPTELYDKLDTLTSKLESITTQLTAKDDTIRTLETTVHHLDAHEQYSRRPNLCIQGISEDGRGEDIESKVLYVVNDKMGFNPSLLSRNANGNLSQTSTFC